MGGFLSNLLGGPVKDMMGSISQIIGEFHTSDAEKLEAQRKLNEIILAFQTRGMELDQQWAATQADVIKTEAGSASWLTRNWRPLTMLFFVAIIGTVVWTGGFVNGHQLDHDFVMEILSIVKLGLSGYVAARTFEKIAPQVTQIFTANKK